MSDYSSADGRGSLGAGNQRRGWVVSLLLRRHWLSVFMALLLLTGLQMLPVRTAAATGEPNIVVLMIDDLDLETLEMAAHPQTCQSPPCTYSGSFMPNYVSLMEEKGTTFTNSFVSYSMCCPSRATFFTGQYAHNHGVQNNSGSNGGCEPFESHEQHTIATWLQDAAYETGLVGKYLNGYGDDPNATTGCHSPEYVPDGWDEWHGIVGETSKVTDYWINDTVAASTTITHYDVFSPSTN
jgi:arylsulfatase A-like enzyme